MSNSELLEAALDAAQGDAYDGEFTKRGEWEYNRLYEALQLRLKGCNYL